ncbi:MAG: hypothetical protein JWN70_588 [Planctomycetaceae bacterium]|nr:hypothetical protein [Planctomycetaceae bacterium]
MEEISNKAFAFVNRWLLNGPRTTNNEQRTTDNGQRTTDNGQAGCLSYASHHLLSKAKSASSDLASTVYFNSDFALYFAGILSSVISSTGLLGSLA